MIIRESVIKGFTPELVETQIFTSKIDFIQRDKYKYSSSTVYGESDATYLNRLMDILDGVSIVRAELPYGSGTSYSFKDDYEADVLVFTMDSGKEVTLLLKTISEEEDTCSFE